MRIGLGHRVRNQRGHRQRLHFQQPAHPRHRPRRNRRRCLCRRDSAESAAVAGDAACCPAIVLAAADAARIPFTKSRLRMVLFSPEEVKSRSEEIATSPQAPPMVRYDFPIRMNSLPRLRLTL
jgi:hypothetical protein